MKYLSISTITLSLLAIIFLTSCDKECVESNLLEDPVYFQFDALNYAWGLYHIGWFIDNKGKFHEYNLPESWIEPDTLGYISKQDVLSNLAKADSVVYSITESELKKQVALIEDVDEKSFSEPDHVGADIGLVNLFAYRWDKNHQAYKRILLATGGDVEQHNLDREAIELTAWLVALGEASGTFSWH